MGRRKERKRHGMGKERGGSTRWSSVPRHESLFSSNTEARRVALRKGLLRGRRTMTGGCSGLQKTEYHPRPQKTGEGAGEPPRYWTERERAYSSKEEEVSRGKTLGFSMVGGAAGKKRPGN